MVSLLTSRGGRMPLSSGMAVQRPAGSVAQRRARGYC